MSEDVSTADVHRFIERLRARCAQGPEVELRKAIARLDGIGSSGLETLGAAGKILVDFGPTIERLLGPAASAEAARLLAFIDKCFGR